METNCSSRMLVSPQEQQLLLAAYHAFNDRDIETVLSMMSPAVSWPNAMEGGYAQGHAQVKAYWLRQWGLIDPLVQPIGIYKDQTARITLQVHQVVKDLSGKVLLEGLVQHVYTLEEGLIKSMEINCS